MTIFTPENCEKVLSGQKTMTRRLVKSGEWLTARPKMGGGQVKVVYDVNRKTKWEVGQTYAIQPGRGVASVGRFTLLDIRRERVQDISEADAIAEGVELNHYYCDEGIAPDFIPVHRCEPSVKFLELFESINGKQAVEDNPEVWVLSFEVVR